MKKGQAAMEYLMTYGWAILIVIAVVAALYAMGVFRLPSGGLGKCSPCFGSGAGLTYKDHNADNLVLVVGPSQVKNIRVIDSGTNTQIAGVDSNTYDPGATVTLACTTAGCFSGDVSIIVEYQDAESGLYHNITATIHGA